MKSRFDKLVSIILKHEGGYVNDPDDLGGETKYGISRHRYPDLDIRNLTEEQARAIIYEDFYLKMRLHYIKSDLLALHVLDMGFNAGRYTAVRLLQELLLGIPVDGVIGPVTAAAIAHASIHVDMVKAYRAKRIERYYEVSRLRNNKKFLKGWVNRVNKTVLDG